MIYWISEIIERKSLVHESRSSSDSVNSTSRGVWCSNKETLAIVHFLARCFFIPSYLTHNEFDRFVVSSSEYHYVVSIGKVRNDMTSLILLNGVKL